MNEGTAESVKKELFTIEKSKSCCSITRKTQRSIMGLKFCGGGVSFASFLPYPAIGPDASSRNELRRVLQVGMVDP